ncbi:MAG: GGDEF domain-containing phosphodiesterase [Pseudomonadota bacterium]
MSHPHDPLHQGEVKAWQYEHVRIAIGIDNLATLQELFGDALGQEIVSEVEQRIKRTIPSAASIQTTPHLKFVVLVQGFQQAEVERLLLQIQSNVATDPIETFFGPVAVTVSIGCAPFDASNVEELQDSETVSLHALHVAMARGIGAIEIADDDLALLIYRSELMAASQATTNAMRRDDLVVVHQPVVRATGGHTISFHECLVRVRRPDGSLLSAGEFMPAIERLGMAPLIDQRVLEATFQTLRQHESARLSVNIFPQTMQDRRWLSSFEDLVENAPELAERLIIEVTETAAMLDVARTRGFMDRLRAHGVSFALDDFGAGNTSLRHLRDLRFDVLKIDGQFIRNIENSPDDAFLVETLVSIANRYEMMTVAEAVQTPAEARCLSELGVEYFQGFFFGSPSLLLNPTENPMPIVAAQA